MSHQPDHHREPLKDNVSFSFRYRSLPWRYCLKRRFLGHTQYHYVWMGPWDWILNKHCHLDKLCPWRKPNLTHNSRHSITLKIILLENLGGFLLRMNVYDIFCPWVILSFSVIFCFLEPESPKWSFHQFTAKWKLSA